MLGTWHMGSPWLMLGLYIRVTHAANILAIFTYCSPSPYMVVRPYLEAIVAKGHQVTIISSIQHLADIEGAQHIRVQNLDSMLDDLSNFDFDEEYKSNKWKEASFASNWFYNSSLAVLSDAGVLALLHDANSQFDMVIVQATFTDALIGFAHHYNAILVGISPYGTTWNIDYLAGNKASSVYEPMSPAGYSLGTGVWDRLANWAYITEEWLLERMVYLPAQVKLYKRFFNRTTEEFCNIRRNFSLILINQHFSLGRARPNVPNVIEIAGLHMTEPSDPLDASLKQFLDEAEHGVIYFSMGLEIIAKWLPPNMLQTMQQSLSQLPQRIVWKYEVELVPNKSDNIYIRPMLPQREILAHPNVKLFITHGGMLSIIEAAYYAVPMLCLPVYYDQFGNADRMKKSGVAQIEDIVTMTVESTTNAIKDLIENPVYTQNMKQMSKRLRDQPMNPLDTAVWWTEYVLRHQGAHHMRLSEQDVSFLQYYNLDIISMILGRIGVAILLLTVIAVKLIEVFVRPLNLRFTVPLLK